MGQGDQWEAFGRGHLVVQVMMSAEGKFDQAQKDHWETRTNLRTYDHPVVRAFATQRVDFIRRLFGSWQPASGLEVGCGDGFGMQHMTALIPAIHGCDISPAMLAANPADDDRLTLADAYDLPFESGQFDLVYCWELLHHVASPQRAVEEMKRVAKTAVLLCEPNCLNLPMAAFGILKPWERGLLRFTPGYTKRLLSKAGLHDIRVYSVGCFTPNRTPEWLARQMLKLPYRWPWIGMYNIAIGYQSGQRPAATASGATHDASHQAHQPAPHFRNASQHQSRRSSAR